MMRKGEINIKFIIEGCLKGNRQSQRTLYEHFYGYGLNICLRYSKNKEESEEILNNGFLKVFNNIEKYDPAQPFRFWFRRILINAAIDHHRTNQNKIVFLELKAAANETYDDFPLPKISPDEDVLPVLQQLTPAYRMVFNLYVMERYRHDEIAEMLGISASTSRANLVRAKEKLRSLITKETVQALKKNG